MRKLLVIGLDGASTNVLEPLMADGRLEAFEDIWRNGTVRSLHVNSNDRGWPSILSGRRAADLGSFYFWRDPDKRRPRPELHPGAWLQGKTILDALSRKGARIVAVNCPMTSPAWKINGVIVSGAGGGSKPGLPNGVHPADLADRYADAFEGYMFDVRKGNYADRPPVDLVRDLVRMTDARTRLACDLLRRENWDLGFVTFVGLDRLLHWVWDALPALGESPDVMLTPAIADYFAALDRAVTELTEVAGGADILLVADHGFQKLERNFYLNDWLFQKEFQARKSFGTSIIGTGKSLARKTLHSIYKPKKKGGAARKSSDTFYLPELNWARSTAYGDVAPGIFLAPHLAEAERAELVETIVAGVQSALGGDLDGLVIGAATRERFYGSGEALHLSPEIVIDVAPGTQIARQIRGVGPNDPVASERALCTDWRRLATSMQGIHASNALLGAKGARAEVCCEGKTNLDEFASIVETYFAD